MDGKITYHQQVTYCGKPRCRKCREGIGHGPYWYSYQTVNGQTTRTYIGKTLPLAVQAALGTVPPSIGDSDMAVNYSPLSAADPGTSMIRIWTLGQFRIDRSYHQQWSPVTDSAWQQHNVRSLLAYLICSPERRASRSQIIAALWPTLEIGMASSRLNKTVQNLRKVLGHPAVDAGSMQGDAFRVGALPLLVDGEWLSLANQEHIWIDADAFEERSVAFLGDKAHYEHGEQRAASDVSVDSLQHERVLREVVTLYSGNFLPEEQVSEWVITRRQVLRRHWIEFLLELVDLYTTRGASSSAIDILDRLLASDPTNEPAVQRLIVVLSHLKRRGEALRAYQSFADVLQREYAAVPSEETRAFYEAVRRGNALPERVTDPLAPAAVGATATLAPDRRSVARGFPLESIGRSNQSPLVGRTHELATMHELLLEVEHSAQLQSVGRYKPSGIPLDTQRRPQCLLVMGETGIGKTRLAEEMSREAQKRGWTIVWSRLFTQESSIPYRLWTDALRKILNLGTGLLPVLDPYLLQPLLSFLPALREFMPQTILDQAPSLLAFTPEQEQLRLWEAIGNLFKTISEHTPLLLVLDDIQWADGSSHELLGYLARHLHGYPVLFLATCRDTELPKRPPHPLRKLVFHMQREHTIKTLNVDPLTSEQIALLVSSTTALPEDKVKHIQDHAAGNPFFAEELARSTPPVLPMTVTAALDNRMEKLSKPCRQLLGNAAVLGGSFKFPVICAMEVGSELADDDIVLELLEEALLAGVLTDEGTGTRITYHFWHPLLVSHLYEDLSGIRKARLHLRAAEVLRRIHQRDEEEAAATVTYHLVKGDAESSQIAYYAELAGNRAYSVFAYSEAEHLYGLAVEHMEQVQQNNSQAHLASLLERFAECMMVRGHFARARHLYERVLKLRAQLPAPAEDSQYEAQLQSLLWGEIGLTWRYTGDNTHAWEAFERSEQVLRDVGVIGGPAWARLYYLRSNFYKAEGRYAEALRVAQEALTLYEQQQKQSIVPSAPVMHTTSFQRTLEGNPINLGRTYRLIGTIAEAMGQLTTALTHQGKALALYEQYGEKRQIAHLSCDMGYTYLKKGKYEQAQAELRRSHSLAESIGDEPLLSLVYSDWGKLAAATGELNEAEDWYRRALELAEALTKDSEYISLWSAGLAAVLQALGKSAEAVQFITRAWKTGRAMHNSPCIGQALVTLGNIRIAQAIGAEDLPAVQKRLLRHAREDIQRALTLDELEVETRISGQLALAHITLLQGQRELARTEIEQALGEAQRYEQAHVETQARRLLEQVNV